MTSLQIASVVLDFVRALAWPLVALLVLLVCRPHIRDVLSRLESAELPGFKFNLREAIAEAKEIFKNVPSPAPPEEKKDVPRIPLNEVNQRMISLGLHPSPSGLDVTYYRELARTDPNVALAGLRLEVDLMGRNLAEGFKIGKAGNGTTQAVLRALHSNAAIDDRQYDLTKRILQVCDAAIHGTRVSIEEANQVIDLAKILTEQYVSWLSWGFPDDWLGQEGALTA